VPNPLCRVRFDRRALGEEWLFSLWRRYSLRPVLWPPAGSFADGPAPGRLFKMCIWKMERPVCLLTCHRSSIVFALRCTQRTGETEERGSALVSLYYFLRPILPVAVPEVISRKLRLRGWEKIPFPQWPVDRTVDNLLEHVLLLSMRAQNLKQIPFNLVLAGSRFQLCPDNA